MENAVDRAAELGLALDLVDPLDLAHLLPGRSHQLLLLILHDERAQPGHPPVSRVEVQLMQPGRRRRLGRRLGHDVHGVLVGLPAAVNRRPEKRLLGRVGEPVLQGLPGRIEDLPERLLELEPGLLVRPIARLPR